MFLLILKQLMGNDLNQRQLSIKSEIPYTTVNGWFTNNKIPNVDQLIKLADHFDVSIDYLVGRENDFGNIEIAQNITIEDSKLLNSYHKLGNFQKGKVEGYINALLEQNQSKNQAERIKHKY